MRSSSDAIDAGIVYVPEERGRHGAIDIRLNDGDVAWHTLDRISSLLFASTGKHLTYKALIA